MIDLKSFRENATKDGLCIEYAEKWDTRKSNKQIMDLALEAKGVDYVCDAIAKGWGISPDYIKNRFGSYINGKYIFDNGAYDSEMYCGYSGKIKCRTTLLTLIDCDVEVEVPEYYLCEIYATGHTNIRLTGRGRAAMVCYGEDKDVKIHTDSTSFKRVQKKEKDSHV